MWAGSTPRSSASHRLLRPLPACKALMIASASASRPPLRPLILARTLRLGFHVGLCEGPGADESRATDQMVGFGIHWGTDIGKQAWRRLAKPVMGCVGST